jgi:hypothetical protein
MSVVIIKNEGRIIHYPKKRRPIMARGRHTQEEVDEFISAAKEMGISPAMRKLNYPASYNTALSWFEKAGLPRPDIDSLMAKAAELKVFYGDREKLYAAQANIDRIVESLHEDDLDADGINKLSNALHKAIQTFNLIEGKATNVTESRTKDAADLAINDMLNAAKAKNALKESKISEA